MIRRYLVVLENGLEKPCAANLCGSVPDVPGCWSTGRTLEELRGNLHYALTLQLGTMTAKKQPAPEPFMGMEDVPAGYIGEWMVVKQPVTKDGSLKKMACKGPQDSEWDVLLKTSAEFLRRRVSFV